MYPWANLSPQSISLTTKNHYHWTFKCSLVLESHGRFVFWFLFISTPLTLLVHQERIRVVRSGKVTVKFLAQVERHSRN